MFSVIQLDLLVCSWCNLDHRTPECQPGILVDPIRAAAFLVLFDSFVFRNQHVLVVANRNVEPLEIGGIEGPDMAADRFQGAKSAARM